jgi:TetR/AcrR family transcriptional repressor of nem operon
MVSETMRPRKFKSSKKLATHEQILESAQTLLKTDGVSGASVEKVMSGAGLTIGGFYSHFKSKENLVAETLHFAFRRGRESAAAALAGLSGRKWLERYLRRYLSRKHRDSTATGCPMPAVLTEVQRAGEAVQDALDDEVQIWARSIAVHLSNGDKAETERDALAILSICVGSLSLARALGDRTLSDKILRSARSFILDHTE